MQNHRVVEPWSVVRCGIWCSNSLSNSMTKATSAYDSRADRGRPSSIKEIFKRHAMDSRADLSLGCHAFRQFPGSDQRVATQKEFLYFVPIDSACVQSQRDPALRCDVGGQIESGGLSLH